MGVWCLWIATTCWRKSRDDGDLGGFKKVDSRGKMDCRAAKAARNDREKLESLCHHYRACSQVREMGRKARICALGLFGRYA